MCSNEMINRINNQLTVAPETELGHDKMKKSVKKWKWIVLLAVLIAVVIPIIIFRVEIWDVLYTVFMVLKGSL